MSQRSISARARRGHRSPIARELRSSYRRVGCVIGQRTAHRLLLPSGRNVSSPATKAPILKSCNSTTFRTAQIGICAEPTGLSDLNTLSTQHRNDLRGYTYGLLQPVLHSVIEFRNRLDSVLRCCSLQVAGPHCVTRRGIAGIAQAQPFDNGLCHVIF